MRVKQWLVLCLASLLIGLGYLGSGVDGWRLLPENALESAILFEIRLPRLVLAGLNGMALGMAGAVLQLQLKNPLAEPGITGIAGGAGLATVVALYWGGLTPIAWSLPLVGMLGGALSLILLWLLSSGQMFGLRLILAGVALASLTGALMAVVLNLAPNPFAFQEWALWLMGSVANRGWSHVWLMAPSLVLALLLLLSQRRFLSAQIFDDATIATLGFQLGWKRFLIFAAVALLVSASVVTAGIIGFVGLLAPHAARLLGQHQPLPMILLSALLGAWLLMLMDWLVRLIPTPVELQLGVVVSLIGAPWLLILLYRQHAAKY